ncbi:hypothetical protein GCM10009559_42810 [Pseudonocardia zijingensis]|uniref:Uncharacterized protein n=1 Tax=Pseudonocardia zijingensis TaxID=153376 RepID=A0ABN1QNK8_9PSEU
MAGPTTTDSREQSPEQPTSLPLRWTPQPVELVQVPDLCWLHWRNGSSQVFGVVQCAVNSMCAVALLLQCAGFEHDTFAWAYPGPASACAATQPPPEPIPPPPESCAYADAHEPGAEA